MKKLTYKQARKEYLQTLYDMSNGEPYQEINLSRLHSKLHSSSSQQLGFMAEQKAEGLVDYPIFGVAMITPKGCIELEKYSDEFANKESQIHSNMRNPEEVKEKGKKFLITLFYLAGEKVGQAVLTETIFDIIGVHDIDDCGQILRYLNKDRWVDWSNNKSIWINNKGLIEVKKLMHSTYAEREFRVLEAIYELGNGKPEAWVIINDLAKALEMSFQEINPILIDLEKQTLIGSVEEAVWILPPGIKMVENTMNDYENKEYQVMKKLVEDCRYKGMTRAELSAALSIPPDELIIFLFDFNKKGWISMAMGENSTIGPTPAGITAFHKWNKQDHSSITNINQNTTNIHGANYGGIQQGGKNNTQNVQANISPDFNNAVKELIDLVNNSDLHDLDKEERLLEIERIKQLTQKEQTPEVKQLGISKFKVLETGLKVGELALKSAPLLSVIGKAFGL